VSAIVIVWVLADQRAKASDARQRWGCLDCWIVLAMTAWLLRIADSATALMCSVLGIGIFLACGLAPIRRRMRRVELYALAGGSTWLLLDWLFGLTEFVVVALGRDMTFTGRTDAWQLVTNFNGLNPLIGAGFKSFWAGERMAEVWRQFPGIVQAHSGYIETYLEGGIIGVILLTAVFGSALARIKRAVLADNMFARVRFTFLFIALLYNFSEAAIMQLSLLWLVTLLIVVESPEPITASAPVVTAVAAAQAPAASPWAMRREVAPSWRMPTARLTRELLQERDR
jgi:O-antigen ligase